MTAKERSGNNPQPGSMFGKYHIKTLLGQGGMGKVYAALDTALNRPVALKFVSASNSDDQHRLLSEARRQARAVHPNICEVYEVGELEGRAYLALQFIDGESLSHNSDLDIREKARVIRDVAAAMHEAHASGLIHRDLKPANIMISLTETGDWKPWVMDFGLARETALPGSTMTGMVAGSPAYMSPEQARGETLDRRSDVYSLGVSLYEIIAGRRPYQARSATELMIKVAQEEPLPLNRAAKHIPPDLVTIVMKCIEPEAAHRYDSARSLAEDLTRFLDGEPVFASRPGITHRLLKKIRKNKRISVAVALLSVIILSLCFWLYRTQQYAREEARLAQDFGRKVEELETRLYQARLLPIHDMRDDRSQARQLIEEIKQTMARKGERSQTIGNYALGRGYAGLQELEQAHRYTDKAWNMGLRTPEAAFQRGKVLSELYMYGRRDLIFLRMQADTDRELERLRQQYRDPALQSLRLAIEGEHSANYIHGLIAYLEEKPDLALKHTAKVKIMRPDYSLARALESEIYLERAIEYRNSGHFEKGIQQCILAEKALIGALDISRSDVNLYYILCDVLTYKMAQHYELDQLTDAHYQAVEQAARNGLAIRPESGKFQQQLSQLNWLWAGFQSDSGQPAIHFLKEAITAGTRAIELAPDDFRSYLNLGYAYLHLGFGNQDFDMINQAIHLAKQGIRIQPASTELWNQLAVSYSTQALMETEYGQDPTASLVEALQAQKTVLKYDQSMYFHFSNIGAYTARLADDRLEYGQPPGDLTDALEYLQKGMDLNPAMPFNYYVAGWIHLLMGIELSRSGQSPDAHFEQAGLILQQGLEKKNNYSYIHLCLGRLWFEKWRYQLTLGHDDRQLWSDAESAFENAWSINPDHLDTYIYMSELYRERAKHVYRVGENPETFHTWATYVLRTIEKVDPNYPKRFIMLAALKLDAWEWGLSEPEPQQIQTWIEAALDKSNRWHKAHVQQARLHWLNQGSQAIESAFQSIENALAKNPKHLPALNLKIQLHQQAAKHGNSEHHLNAAADTRDLIRQINPLLDP